jgi:TatD DNase family protein
VGTTADDTETVVALAAAFPGVYATVGIHPNHAAQAAPDDWTRLPGLAARPRVVAIGETGLDRHWDFTPFDDQRRAFDFHIELAIARDLPLVIHCRESEADVVAALEPHAGRFRGVLHSFTGSADDARAFLDLGLHVSFAGMLTYKGARTDPLREVAAGVRVDRLLVETDSPYLPPVPHRGRTNEPAWVAETGAFLARLRGVDPAELAAQTSANAVRLFRLDESDALDAG